MRKIGILGGAFNPVHNSHIRMAEEIRLALNLEKVLLMPTHIPPHKLSSDFAPNPDRIEMLKLASKDYPYLEVSDFEMQRDSLSYTSDTLALLNEKYPDICFYFIIGGDSLLTFKHWHKPVEILERCTLVATGRNTDDDNEFLNEIDILKKKFTHDDFIPSIIYCPLKLENISSSAIRLGLSTETLPDGQIDDLVLQYIQEHTLYQKPLYEQIKRDLQETLSEHRYTHVINVAKTALKLALAHKVDPYTAYLTGLLHDCAKHYSDSECLALAKKNNISLTRQDYISPSNLLHAKLGSIIAQEKYNITDTDILNAIYNHTEARPGMSLLELILYIADYTEPGRDSIKIPAMSFIRSIAETDLELAAYVRLHNTYHYLSDTVGRDNISDQTIKSYNYYRKLCDDRIPAEYRDKT